MSRQELLHKDEVYAIVGAAMEVYNQLKWGFLEGIYQEALEIEFANRDIPFQAQAKLTVRYKDHPLSKYYIADFLVYDQIVVELKTLSQLSSADEAQLINELRASSYQTGVLLNYGSPSGLEWKRMVLTAPQSILQFTPSKDMK